MILLDTIVVSEFTLPKPNPAVTTWLAEQSFSEVFLSAITEAELRYGVAILPMGRRRERLSIAIETVLQKIFAQRILPFDSNAAGFYAEIAAGRRAMGKPISYPDCQLAAIARCHGAAVATRNVGDYERCGIEVINPWSLDKPSV